MNNNLNNNHNSANEDTNDYSFGDSGISALSFGAGPVSRGAARQQTAIIDSMANIQVGGMGQMGMVKQQQTMVHQQMFAAPISSMSELDIAPNGMSKSKAPQIMVLPNVGTEQMDFSEFAQKAPMHFVASKCVGTNGGGLQPTPAMYSELTSMVVDESPEEVLSKMTTLLNNFSHDIDFSIDAHNFEIHGTVFVKHFAVFFKISIWSESDSSDRTRFECRRQKGDTFGFAEFWEQIEDQLYQNFTNARGARSETEEENEFGDNDDELSGLGGLPSLPPLDYNLDGLPPLDMSLLDGADIDGGDGVEDEKSSGMTPKDLDDFVFDMAQWDSSVVYSIAALLDAFQAQGHLVEMVLNHADFLKCILESALSHQDTALVRGALITLEKLCGTSAGADLLVSYDVLERVVPLLNHRCELIRKYTVRVLSALSSKCSESWKFNNARMAAFASHSVKQCRGKWTTNDFIKAEMFEAIESKLVYSVSVAAN